jgi:hypothetical protein
MFDMGSAIGDVFARAQVRVCLLLAACNLSHIHISSTDHSPFVSSDFLRPASCVLFLASCVLRQRLAPPPPPLLLNCVTWPQARLKPFNDVQRRRFAVCLYGLQNRFGMVIE